MSAARVSLGSATAPGGGALAAAPAGRARRLLGWLATHRRAIGYAAFSATVFLLALLYTLPHDLIARRAIDRATMHAPVDIEFREASFAFPNGYHFQGLRLSARERPDLPLLLEELTLRALLLRLLFGERAVAFRGSLFGGELTGDAVARGAGAAVELAIQDLDLGRASPSFLAPPARITGRASLGLVLSGDGVTIRSAEGEARLSVRGLRLEKLQAHGITLPNLSFEELDGQARIRAARLEVEELRARGPELGFRLSGDILLREPLEQSVLNLELAIDVPPEAPPAVKMATALLPPKPTSQPARWSLRGTPARPSIK